LRTVARERHIQAAGLYAAFSAKDGRQPHGQGTQHVSPNLNTEQVDHVTSIPYRRNLL
jgi:hypothetical protein